MIALGLAILREAAAAGVAFVPGNPVRVRAKVAPPADLLAKLRAAKAEVEAAVRALPVCAECGAAIVDAAAPCRDGARCRPSGWRDLPTGGAVALDAEGLPFAPCRACGCAESWKPADLPPEGPGWQCVACNPPPPDLRRHACAVPDPVAAARTAIVSEITEAEAAALAAAVRR